MNHWIIFFLIFLISKIAGNSGHPHSLLHAQDTENGVCLAYSKTKISGSRAHQHRIRWPSNLTALEEDGLKRQIRILRKTGLGKEIYPKSDLIFVARCLLKKEKRCLGREPSDQLQVRPLRNADGSGNVLYTGYFTPKIQAKKQKTKEYRYPIFRRPKEWREDNGPHATREEIDNQGVLDGKGLEIAWTKQPLAIFQMQLQGSGIASFEDGTQKLLAYDGNNGHPHLSLGKLLIEDGHVSGRWVSINHIENLFQKTPELLAEYLYQNPSYVFFKTKGKYPVGAAGEKLIEGHSIAVDPQVIPFGAILIGKVPVLDAYHRIQKHEWRLLFAQDTGGAIIGPAHVDLFHGIGDEAREAATSMRHYGELWVLLPR